MTLLELLVAVTIILILLAAAAPRLKLGKDSKAVREAARAVNVFVSNARQHAVETQRSCCVVIRGSTITPGGATNLTWAEVPPPYSGNEQTAAARVSTSGGGLQADLGVFDPKQIQPGDQMQFNFQGPWYRVSAVGGQSVTLSTADLPPGQMVPWTNTPSPPVPYKVRRQVANLAKGGLETVAWLQLPPGTLVDLGASGSGSKSGVTPFGGDVSIMFSPSGGVEAVNNAAPGEKVFLLVGRRENMVGGAVLTNIKDVNNFWVTIQSKTGAISTVQVAGDNGLGLVE
jgi:type II secretory pathway pseudopilin PulG